MLKAEMRPSHREPAPQWVDAVSHMSYVTIGPNLPGYRLGLFIANGRHSGDSTVDRQRAMRLHLDAISVLISPGVHAVLVCDGAGWYQKGCALHLPHNINMQPLLSYLSIVSCDGALQIKRPTGPFLGRTRRL